MKALFAKIPARAAIVKLSATNWTVLHIIALHADKDGRAFPSMARIAQIADIHRGNVPRSIARLEDRGLLRCHRSPGRVSRYEILFEPIGDAVVCADDIPVADDDIQARNVVSSDDRVSSPAITTVVCGDALTELLTDQGTEAYQEKAGTLGGGSVPVFSGENDLGANVSISPIAMTSSAGGTTCGRYVPNNIGFRICGKPSVDDGRCAEHINRPNRTAP